MLMVHSDGADLATESFGAPTRGTILLVMGATASMVWWPVSLCQRLADAGYRVIRFDHRDTGGSTTSAPGQVGYGLVDLANDLVAILDGHRVQSAHLVGMSLGGLLAQIVAAQHPERVATLTLIASEPMGMDYEGQGIAPALLDHFGTIGGLDWSDRAAVAGFMLTVAELSAGTAHPFDAAAARARIEQEIARTASMVSAFKHSMIAGELPTGLRADALTLPVLIIHGTDDPVIAFAAARALERAIAGSQLMALRGRGHEIAPADVPAIADRVLALVGR